jgi:KipI family sensor histidine kinase inhibitor
MGDAAVSVAVGGPEEARSLAEAVVGAGWPEVREVVGGLRSVLVVVDPAGADLDALGAAVAQIDPDGSERRPSRTHRLPAAFDGPDLEEVCGQTGIDADELVGLLAATTLRVALVGFSPGFAYLTGLPEPLRAVRRRAVPRPSVPAGSVALAGGFAAVYPQATPGGWQLIGRTAARLFDPMAPPFALLGPGDAVRLVPVPSPGSIGVPPAVTARAPLRPPPGSRAAAVVEDPGILTMVQDGGRRGKASLGVPHAGPADALAHELSNRLVGNHPEAPALEVTARGPVLRCAVPIYVAVAGGDAVVTVDGREVGNGHVLPVEPGQRLAVGPVRTGLRAYLAVAGGWSATEVLGSSSTDVLTGLGPGPLATGDELVVRATPGPMADHLAPGAPGQATPAGSPPRRTLRVLPGPHAEWFPDGAFERLSDLRWEVDGASDRVGVRLRPVTGDGIDRRPGELDSQGMVDGAVQVPPSGAPVLLGPDHATLGGYPVVAVVASADLWVLGQCRPGDEVQLAPVTRAEAAQALGWLTGAVAGAVVGRYPVIPG